MSLNRIYQGSVSHVEIKNPDKTAAKEIPWLLYHHDTTRAAELTKLIPELRQKVEAEIAKRAKLSKDERKGTRKSPELEEYEKLRDDQRREWQAALWEHHRLFHDAVNYYAFALAAMADGMTEKDEDGKAKPTAMAQFAEQLFGNGKPPTDANHIEGRWNDFVHKGGKRAGLKHSLARTLGLDAKTITREQCVDRIFGHAFAKFPKTGDGKLHDVFRGVTGELFPAKNRGTPQKLANEDPGWLCWKDKGGEAPGDKTFRKQNGINDFMARLFNADPARLKDLSGLSVQESALSGVVENKTEDETQDDGLPDDETDFDAVEITGLEAVRIFKRCVTTARDLLHDENFRRLFSRLGGEAFNIEGELSWLDVLVQTKREESAQPDFSSKFGFQDWKRSGLGKDNIRVELFVLFHCTDGSPFTATLLKARLLGLYTKWLHSADKGRYVNFVDLFNLASDGGPEPKEKLEKARKAAAKPDYKPETSTFIKTRFIPDLKKELDCVFPSFTAIRGFAAQEGDPAEPNGACKQGYFGWTKFDNAAYEEAIKSPHQIRQKKKERDSEKKNLEEFIKLYEGTGREKGKADDGEDEDFIPGGFSDTGDPRFAAMKRIHELLVVADGADPKKLYRYGISQAALRGYEELREEWNKVLQKGYGNSDEELATKLKNCLKTHLAQHFDDKGDSRLFEKFIEKNNWCVWQTPKPEDETERVKKRYSTNIVRDYLRYCDLLEDLEKKERPVQYTPADATESRRLFDFKGASQGGFEHQADAGGLSFTTQIAVQGTDKAGAVYHSQPVRIHYTAPRLLRDEARVLSEIESLQSANWEQPLMRALGIPEDDRHDFKKHAVSLMPDWKPGNRSPDPDGLLLNFVLTPDENKFISHLRNQMGKGEWPWDWQFMCFGKGKKPREYTQTSLCWPHESATWEAMKKKKGFPGFWFANPNVKTFRLLSVDLGQKQAGAYAIIEVSCQLSSEKKKRARFIGKTELAGEQRDWYARVVTMGLLKLPGEDAEVFRAANEYDKQRAIARNKEIPSGKGFHEEYSGSAGRLATPTETGNTINLLIEMQQLGLLGDDPATAKEDSKRLTFPEQNAKLLIALRRAQNFAGRLHRWCWFLDPQDKIERKDQAERRRTAIKEIAEADPNEWLNKDAHDKAKARDGQLGEGKEEPELHPEIVKALKADLAKLIERLPSWLKTIANRVYHSRSGRLLWINHPDKADCHLLDFSLLSKEQLDQLTEEEKWLGGQRGLSIERIEQLEELRKRCQSLNQMLRREIGCAPKATRDDTIPDPCPTILAKLDEIKEQRRNQTAHMILTQALGLTLAKPTEPANDAEREDRESKDIHGEYIKADDKGHPVLPGKDNKWRSVVDFVVIEDLSRYRTSQGRAPRENSRLMKWCHRAIRDKLKQMCEPFGIPLVETPAAYSSRFCSRTGVAGFRATEISGDPLEESKWRWRIRKPEEGKTESEDQKKRREQWELLLKQIQTVNSGRDGRTKGQQRRTLLAPDAGGSIFIPVSKLMAGYKRQTKDEPIVQYEPVALEENQERQPKLIHADINAAVNLALRTVSDPRVWSIHSRLRSERTFVMQANLKPRRASKKATAQATEIPLQDIKPDTFWVSEKEKRKFGEQTKVNRVQIRIIAAEEALKEADIAADESEKRKLREKAVARVPKASDSRHPNFFADVADLRETHWGAASLDKLPTSFQAPVHLVSSKALWGYVKEQAWKRCMAINAARLRVWKIEPPKEWET